MMDVTPGLELLSEDIRRLDFRGCDEEFLGAGKEGFRHFTVDMCRSSVFILERVEDPEACGADPECEPGRGSGLSFDEGPCRSQEGFYLSLFARPCLQRRQYAELVHSMSPDGLSIRWYLSCGRFGLECA